MPTWLQGLLIVGLSVGLALAGQYLVRRYVPFDVILEHHEVGGFFLQIIGTAYSVLLAFVVFVVWTQFDDAKKITDTEANHLGDVYRLAQGLPAPAQQRIHDASRVYVRAVIEKEWSRMASGDDSPEALAALDTLWRVVRDDVSVQTPKESALYQGLLTQVTLVDDSRTQRLLAARDSIHPFLWFMLIAGAIITIVFTYFFGVRSFRSQAIMTVALTTLISFILFLIAAFDRPFTGDIRVPPESFQYTIELFDKLG